MQRTQHVLMVGIIVGLAATASGQPLTGQVKWEASADGGVTWRSYLPLEPGSPYKVRAMGSWTDGATASPGFAAVGFEQIDLVGAGTADVFDIAGAYTLQQIQPRVFTVQPGTGASAGFLKIDDIDPVRRCFFSQFPKILPGGIPNPSFSTDNPILLVQMDAIAAPDPAGRLITISGTWHRDGIPLANYMRIYTTETGSNVRPAQEATQMGVTIDTIVPGPGTLVPVGLFVGCGVTRRRRCS